MSYSLPTTARLLTELGVNLNQQQNEKTAQRLRQENILNNQQKLEKQQRSYNNQLTRKQQQAQQPSHSHHDAHQGCIHNQKQRIKRR